MHNERRISRLQIPGAPCHRLIFSFTVTRPKSKYLHLKKKKKKKNKKEEHVTCDLVITARTGLGLVRVDRRLHSATEESLRLYNFEACQTLRSGSLKRTTYSDLYYLHACVSPVQVSRTVRDTIPQKRWILLHSLLLSSK